MEALGAQTRVVLPSPSPLSVLCSLGNRVPLTGNKLVQITGPGLWQLGSGLAVGWMVEARALFIPDRSILPVLATTQLILLVLSVPAWATLGSTILTLTGLRATLTFTTRIPLWLRSLLLLTWTQAMTLWQELQIELKTSV